MNKTTLLLTFALGLILSAQQASAQAGGSLTPPAGAPGQTMKSLDQIEPRTPLVDGAPGVSVAASGTITISQSGSYYLTENLSVTSGDGISVDADGVTLDLRGFTITSSSAAASSDAIDLNGSHISVFNGHIISGSTYDSGSGTFSGGGFQFGVYAASTLYRHIRLRYLSVQGCAFFGIYCTDLDTSQAEACSVSSCGSIGIRAAMVSRSTSEGCASSGIFAESVIHCRSETITGNAISADLVSNSYGRTNGIGDGISAFNVQNSYGIASSSSGATGIDATYSVTNSFGRTSGSGDGIEASSVQNSYGFASTSGITGIDASSSVTNSFGQTSGTGDGIEADIISYSRGFQSGAGSGFDLQCDIAVGCISSGGEDIGNKYLMP